MTMLLPIVFALMMCIPVLDGAPSRNEACTMLKDNGPCFGYNPRYYYDGMNRMCHMFIYGGCQGNGNNFNTKSECEKACRK